MSEEKKPTSAEASADKEKIEVPKHLEEIVKKIEDLKAKDLADLVKVLEDKFGVSAAASVAVAQAGAPAGGAAAPEEEKTEFNVVLTAPGASKISVIKAVKEITGKGLKESKDIVDATDKEPQVLKEKVKKEEAEEMKKKLEEAGAGVDLK